MRALSGQGLAIISVALRPNGCRLARLDELQADLNTRLHEYNDSRPHSGKYCFGKTPMQMFLDHLPLAKEKILDQTVRTTADVA